MEKPWELMPVLRTCQRDRSRSQRHESVTGSSSENTYALGGSLDVRARVSLSKSRCFFQPSGSLFDASVKWGAKRLYLCEAL